MIGVWGPTPASIIVELEPSNLEGGLKLALANLQVLNLAELERSAYEGSSGRC